MARESSLDRYTRLINLVPMLYANPDLEIAEVADDLGISQKQLLDDLNLLWVCGLPGHSHLELIDLDFESGFIRILEPQNLIRPLKFTPVELTEILLGLELLAAEVDPGALYLVERVREKLSHVLKFDSDVSELIQVDRDLPREDLVLTRKLLLESIAQSRDVIAIYESLSGKPATERILTPIEVITRDGHDYLAASEKSEGVRKIFRIDRFKEVALGESSGESPGENPGESPTNTGALLNVHPPVGVHLPVGKVLILEVPRERAFLGDRVGADTLKASPEGSLSEDRIRLKFSYFEVDFAARVILAFGPETRIIEAGGSSTGGAQEAIEARVGEYRTALRANYGLTS